MDKRAIMVVRDYMLDLEEPKCVFRKTSFKQASYVRWAADEIMRCLQADSLLSPTRIMEKLIAQANHYSKLKPSNNFMFIIVRDMAEDILDIFRAMN